MNMRRSPHIILLATILATATSSKVSLGQTATLQSDREIFGSATPQRALRIGTTNIYHLKENQSVFFFEAKMQINADGAPKAYHKDTNLGLDHLANAGSEGNWWGIVTDTGNADGKPILQGKGDPAPGFYVSGTALQDSTKSNEDQKRYVNSEAIPFYVLPKNIPIPMKIGDFGYVVNRSNNTSSGCIFADVGPKGSLGEGSIALAKAIGIQCDPRSEGSEETYVYVIFSNTSLGWPLDPKFIAEHAKALFAQWGGMPRLQQVLPKTLTLADKRQPSPHSSRNGVTVTDKRRQYRIANANNQQQVSQK